MKSMQEVLAKVDLLHFGIPGMKWGVRRPRGPAGTVSSSPDAQATAAAISKVAKGGTSTLSNQELQSLITRMDLERRFATLATPPPKAQGFIMRMLTENGSRQINRLAKTGVDIAVERALAKAGTHSKKDNPFASELSTRIGPGKKKDKGS